MKVLAITNLFPNTREPNRGTFNLQQLAALRRHAEVRVIAPVAWQPWSRGGRQRVPYAETWCGIPTLHPYYAYTPGIGRRAYSLWMYASLQGVAQRVAQEFAPDVLLGTWAYPDAVAVAMLARRLGLPWVAKVHGNDINVLAGKPSLRRQIRWALCRASATFAVSEALKQRLVEIGIPAEAIRVQHNGVDTERFHLQDKTAARRKTGLPLDRPLVTYVGNLKVSKGVIDLVEAARLLPRDGQQSPLIALVGGGEAHDALAAAIARHGLTDHVRPVGPRPHEEIPDWIAAADALCLPSHQEGCPNVVLEALACGRPVVACHVGAVPDLIDAAAGAVVPPRNPPELAAALQAVLAGDWDAAALRRRVLPLSWEENTRVLATELARAARLVRC